MGQALAGKAGVAGGQERGKVELVGCWLLATHSPDASFPPPHSGTSEFDGFPTPALTTAQLVPLDIPFPICLLLTAISLDISISPASPQIATNPQCDVAMLRTVIPHQVDGPAPAGGDFFPRSALTEALVLEDTRRSSPSRAQWIQDQTHWATPSDSQRLDPSIISANIIGLSSRHRYHSCSSTCTCSTHHTAHITQQSSPRAVSTYIQARLLLAPSHSIG